MRNKQITNEKVEKMEVEMAKLRGVVTERGWRFWREGGERGYGG